MYYDLNGLELIIIGSEEYRKKVQSTLDKLKNKSDYIRCVIESLEDKEIISKLEHMGAKNPSVYLLTPKGWIKKMNKNGESIIGKLEDCECEEN